MAEFAGNWTLRNFNPTFVVVNETPEENAFTAKALDLTLSATPDPSSLAGTIGWRGDPPRDPPGVLDVDGKIDQTHGLGNEMFYLTATGRGGTPTAGWQYDYHGRPGQNWALRDRGRVDRHPTLVGTVIRVKPHRESRAGEVLSFIAVKPQQARERHHVDI
jgi:hypothetical protein